MATSKIDHKVLEQGLAKDLERAYSINKQRSADWDAIVLRSSVGGIVAILAIISSLMSKAAPYPVVLWYVCLLFVVSYLLVLSGRYVSLKFSDILIQRLYSGDDRDIYYEALIATDDNEHKRNLQLFVKSPLRAVSRYFYYSAISVFLFALVLSFIVLFEYSTGSLFWLTAF